MFRIKLQNWKQKNLKYTNLTRTAWLLLFLFNNIEQNKKKLEKNSVDSHCWMLCPLFPYSLFVLLVLCCDIFEYISGLTLKSYLSSGIQSKYSRMTELLLHSVRSQTYIQYTLIHVVQMANSYSCKMMQMVVFSHHRSTRFILYKWKASSGLDIGRSPRQFRLKYYT